MSQFFDFLKKHKGQSHPWIFRVLYKLIDRFDKQKQVVFMNFGYSQPEDKVALDNDDEINRYSIQLYHQLIENVDLSDKIIVEIGCGRGGGLAYIAKNFKASSLIGIDLEKSAVNFANRHYNYNNLSYITGNAEQIHLSDNSCDFVLNVESSHRYLEVKKFIEEVRRILKPGGRFLFTDFRYDNEWPDLLLLINTSGLITIMEKDITSNVVLALQRDCSRRISLIEANTPKILHKQIQNFAGCPGSETYDYFLNGKYIYRSFVFQNTK